MVTTHDISRTIEHTLLKPDTIEADIVRICEETRQHRFHGVCVNPFWVTTAAASLTGSALAVVSVAGFPTGAHLPEVKMREALLAAESGASEIDVVANIGLLRSGFFSEAETELEEIRLRLPQSVALKVIIEVSLLTTEQQMDAVRMCVNTGAEFVKSGTGYYGAVTVEQIETMAMAAHGNIKVKASGGIRTAEQCRVLLEAGASRLGTTAGVLIMQEVSKS